MVLWEQVICSMNSYKSYARVTILSALIWFFLWNWWKSIAPAYGDSQLPRTTAELRGLEIWAISASPHEIAADRTPTCCTKRWQKPRSMRLRSFSGLEPYPKPSVWMGNGSRACGNAFPADSPPGGAGDPNLVVTVECLPRGHPHWKIVWPITETRACHVLPYPAIAGRPWRMCRNWTTGGSHQSVHHQYVWNDLPV